MNIDIDTDELMILMSDMNIKDENNVYINEYEELMESYYTREMDADIDNVLMKTDVRYQRYLKNGYFNDNIELVKYMEDFLQLRIWFDKLQKFEMMKMIDNEIINILMKVETDECEYDNKLYDDFEMV
jgi:hypothetical protein